jgi:hypothetical protein
VRIVHDVVQRGSGVRRHGLRRVVLVSEDQLLGRLP